MIEKNKLVIKITTAAFFLATAIVLTRFVGIITLGGLLRISFGQVAIQLAGLILGPLFGASVGLLADLLGVIILSQGTFHLGFTMDAVMIGLLFGLAGLCLRKHSLLSEKTSGKSARLKMLAIIASVQFIVTVFINLLTRSFWLRSLYELPYFEVLLVRALPTLLIGLIYFFLTYSLIEIFKKAKLKIF